MQESQAGPLLVVSVDEVYFWYCLCHSAGTEFSYVLIVGGVVEIEELVDAGFQTQCGVLSRFELFHRQQAVDAVKQQQRDKRGRAYFDDAAHGSLEKQESQGDA